MNRTNALPNSKSCCWWLTYPAISNEWRCGIDTFESIFTRAFNTCVYINYCVESHTDPADPMNSFHVHALVSLNFELQLKKRADYFDISIAGKMRHPHIHIPWSTKNIEHYQDKNFVHRAEWGKRPECKHYSRVPKKEALRLKDLLDNPSATLTSTNPTIFQLNAFQKAFAMLPSIRAEEEFRAKPALPDSFDYTFCNSQKETFFFDKGKKKGHYIWGPSNMGKTRFISELRNQFRVQQVRFDGHFCQFENPLTLPVTQVLYLDEAGPNSLPSSTLKQIIGAEHPILLNIKGGSISLPPKMYVVICSNHPMEKTFADYSIEHSYLLERFYVTQLS